MQNKLLKVISYFFIFLFIFSFEKEALAQSKKKTKTTTTKTTKPASKKRSTSKNTSETIKTATQAKITKIDVVGVRKIETEAILVKIGSKVGDLFSEKTVTADIQALFRMGYFVQIEVFKEVAQGGLALEYKVVEKPVIAEIIFEGNSEIKSEDLEKEADLKNYEILNHGKVKEAIQKMEKQYEDKGYYLVKIEPVIEDIKKDETVRLKFNITENDKVKVKKISFIGNHQVTDSYLKSRLFTQEAGYFSSLSGSGSFKQEAFERDIQVLKYMYWNQGYVQVKVDRPLVTVTPDKKSIYITYHIEEGLQYFIGEVDFGGDLLFPKSELYDATRIKDNGVFAVDVMQRDISELQAKYGDLGYAFTNVIPSYNFHEKEKKVDLIFQFEKGEKVYFGSINVVGNAKTRDKVVRRELKVSEGELYNETRKRISQENVQRLGFFEQVEFKTSTPPDRSNELNIDIVVKERNTGQLQLTAGYGNIQGLSLGGSIQQTNFRGLGQTLGARIDYTKGRQDYSLSLTEPYFQDTLWSAGFDIFFIENRERIYYFNRKYGGAVRFGHPVYGDYTRAYVRYKIDKSDLYENENTDPFLFPLDTARGLTSAAMVTLEYDTRNDRFSPSKGIFTDISYERAGLGGDLNYQTFSGRFRFFQSLWGDLVWRNNVAYAHIMPVGEKDVPFTERFQMGGAYSLRGYGYGTVGRTIFSQFRYDQIGTSGSPFYNANITEEERRKRSNLVFGGTKQLLFQTELQFPMIKEAGLTGVLFYDIGQAEDEITQSKFMSDFGVGFRWLSPLGLLRFEWGWPLNKDDYYGRDAVNFEFSIGPPF